MNYNIKKYRKDGRVVVYCGSQGNVDKISNYLSKKFPGEVVKCHAYMDSDKREKHEMQFINGSKPIMVATSAFGMGIDAPDIRSVPLTITSRLAARAVMARSPMLCCLYHTDDNALNQYILKNGELPPAIQDWLTDRLADTGKIQEIKSDPYNLDRQFKSQYFVEGGVRMRIYQSHNKSNGIDFAINPSTLLSGKYQPVKLWEPTSEAAGG